MRKIISVYSSLIFVSLFLLSNTAIAQLRIGANLGFNFSNMVLADEGSIGTYNTKMGIRLGISGKYEAKKSLDVVGSVLYSVKGFIYENSNVRYRHFNYIEIPVSLALKKSVTPKIKIMGIAGIYTGLGISGVYDPFNRDGLGYNPLDLGLIIGGGVEIGRSFQTRIAYQPGFGDLALNEDDATLLNQVMSLDFMYFFGK